MKVQCYLILSPTRNSVRKGAKAARMTKNKPSLGAKEIAIKLDINLPNDIFEKVIPVAKLEVKDSHIIEPDVAVLEANEGEPVDEEDEL